MGCDKGEVGGRVRKASAACHSNVQHVPVGDRVARDLDEAIDWQWLHRAYTAAGSASFSSCTLWAGHGGGCTPMHYDATNNL